MFEETSTSFIILRSNIDPSNKNVALFFCVIFFIFHLMTYLTKIGYRKRSWHGFEKTLPSSIGWYLNSRPFNHESTSLTTRPGKNVAVYIVNFLCYISQTWLTLKQSSFCHFKVQQSSGIWVEKPRWIFKVIFYHFWSKLHF